MIIFFYGEDDFCAKKKVKELREKFSREVNGAGDGFEYLDGEKTTLREINEKSAAASLWASKRLVVIENIFRTKTKELLGEILKFLQDKEKAGNENVLIFVENFIKTKKKFTGSETVKLDLDGREKPLTKAEKELFSFLNSSKVKQEFKKMSNSEMAEWIKKEVSSRGGKISSRAAIILVALTSGDLWQVDNEINKLINYNNGKVPLINDGAQKEIIEISEDDVKNNVRGQFEENIFALTDAIGARNRSLAIKLFEEEIQSGANEIYLLSMIIRQIKIILQVASAMSSGLSERQIASEFKINSYVVSKASTQSRNFSPVQLKNMFAELIEIDHKIKSGQGKADILLGLWISKI